MTVKAKLIFGLARYIGLNGKQASGQAIARRSFGGGGSDEKSLEIGTAKGTSGDVFHGHFHQAINFSIGSNPHNAVSIEPAIPKIAFRIDGRAVR